VLHLAYLSLGSNLGEREANLRACIARLSGLGNVRRVSSLYETEPMELREQPWFLNCAVEIETKLSPEQLLASIQKIEMELGRQREIDKGPRTVDIDILLFDSLVFDQGDLQIPHSAMHQRRFVLAPLAEIAPEITHPVLQKTVVQLFAELGTQSGAVRRVSTK
jgi:2-amino-4-hydroxy-6-hydroxymethyldihydropteridine diphosphokinase